MRVLALLAAVAAVAGAVSVSPARLTLAEGSSGEYTLTGGDTDATIGVSVPAGSLLHVEPALVVLPAGGSAVVRVTALNDLAVTGDRETVLSQRVILGAASSSSASSSEVSVLVLEDDVAAVRVLEEAGGSVVVELTAEPLEAVTVRAFRGGQLAGELVFSSSSSSPWTVGQRVASSEPGEWTFESEWPLSSPSA